MAAVLLIMLVASLVGIAAYIGDVYVAKVAAIFARFIRLDSLKRAQLQNALSIAGIKMTPEDYVAFAIARGVLVFLISILLWFVSPLMVLVGFAIGCLVGFAKYQDVLDSVAKRRKLIEAELPRFASSIGQNLEIDRDILRMFLAYRRVAGDAFGAELDQTIADMKLGNYENALLRLESRVNSPLMSDVVRGLIGVLRGDDQRVYFKMICFDMRQLEQANLKKEAQKRPQAMQKYCMFMLFCILIIYGVVLVSETITALGVLF